MERIVIGIGIGLLTLGVIIVAEGRGDLYRWSDPDGGTGFCDEGGAQDTCGMRIIYQQPTTAPPPTTP